MKNKTRFFVSNKNVLTWLVALCMVCSVVARFVFIGAKGADVWSQIVLPVAAALLFALICLLDGKEHFYKTAIPVWMICLYYFFVFSGVHYAAHDKLIAALFAIALLLEVCHHIGHHSQTVYDGKWENCIDWCYWDYPLIELADKTYGLLGCGNIGIHTAEIAKALGMRVIAYDARETEAARALGVEYVTLDELFAQSDVLGLQMPLFPFNTGIINKENIAKMKDGVIIINNSRGQMVVEQDLADALNSGKVAGAGLDVVSTEPIRGDNPLLKAKNCIITPHMSWGAKESRQRIMNTTVENVKAYLDGAPINVVNQ